MPHRIAKPKARRKSWGKTFIKEWRVYRELTQEVLAERLETTAASISRLERGLQPWDGFVLAALADALQCEPLDLLTRNPRDPESIWTIWDSLPPSLQKQGKRLLKALKDEAA